MLYIDANIFLFSILNTESYGRKREAVASKDFKKVKKKRCDFQS